MERFILSLPRGFKSTITASDRRKPTIILEKGCDFVTVNPQCKLSDEDVYKERVQTVNAVVSVINNAAASEVTSTQAQ